MKKLLFLFIFVGSISGFSQGKIGNQVIDKFPINNWAVPTTQYGLVCLPSDYTTSTRLYPLIIHLHGKGEVGSGDTGLTKLITTSLPQRIAQGFKPWAKGGPDYPNGTEFIVVSPQSAYSPGTQEDQLQYILPDILKRYRIDKRYIAVTGYSNGGYEAWTCISDNFFFCQQLSSVIPVSAAPVEAQFNLNGTIIQRVASIPVNVANSRLPVWSICGMLDYFITFADSYTTAINVTTSGPKAIETRLPNVGHWAWNYAYDSAFRPNGVNMYEWILSNPKNLLLQIPPPPIARINIDSSVIHNPNSFVRVNADSCVRAASYQWVQFSGPTAGIWTAIGGTAHKADMLISGLFPGTYVFGLYVNDSLLRMDSTKVIVTVNPVVCPTCPVCPPPIVCPPPRTVTGVTVVMVGGVPTLKFTYSDGNP